MVSATPFSLLFESLGVSLMNPLVWILPVLSFFLKRRMVNGGSWLWRRLRREALKRKLRGRKRLRDFLNDPLLREQMFKAFTKEMGESDATDHMLVLEKRAFGQEITMDDVSLSIKDIMGAAMAWIWLAMAIAFLINFFITDRNHAYSLLPVWVLWMSIHVIDNYVNFSAMDKFVACGIRPSKESESNEILHV